MRLVFLHAFPLDQTMWDEQLRIAPDLSITPTLYQFGESLECWATSVLKLVGSKPMIAIGSSMGGSCAIEMARQAPEQIAGLVLVGAKAGHRPEPALRDSYIDTLQTSGVNGIWPEISSTWFGPTISHRVIEKIKSIANAQDTNDLINAVSVFHGRPDLTDVVAQWKKPLLVVCGENDTIVTEQKANAVSRLASDSKLHVMAGCGHLMNMERPDEFNQVITDFIQKVETGRAA